MPKPSKRTSTAKNRRKKSSKINTAKSKLSPKVGTSKKARTRKHSRVNKQEARAKAKATARNKLNKLAKKEKEAKAKKHRKELKKPSAKTGKAKKSLSGNKSGVLHGEHDANGNFISPNQLELSENILKKKLEHEAIIHAADPSHAPGKKHLKLIDNAGAHNSEFEMNSRNELKARPEAYPKRGRSTAPRATLPTR